MFSILLLIGIVKKLVDPAKPVLLTMHRNIDQFIQQVNHNYINYYDNVKYIPSWLSDEICKAVTGAGHSKRMHYTNDDDVIYEHRRCLGLNGINVALIEADALDRSILIELEDIDEDERRKEADLWKEFDILKPQALAFILDTIVKAIQIKSTLNLKSLPRMADFAEWGEAISQAMGYSPMSFIEIYAENRNEQNIVAVNENLVGSILLKYILDNEKQQKGLITKIQYEPLELYNELSDYAENNNIRIDGRQFPKDAANLVKKIKTAIPNLKAGYGIVIEIGRSEDNTSIITIYRKTPSAKVVVTTAVASYTYSPLPLHQHLYATEVLRKNQVDYYYNQVKSEYIYTIGKTLHAERNNNLSVGGTEAPEPISSKSAKDNFHNIDTLNSDSIENNTTELITDSISNLDDKGDKS